MKTLMNSIIVVLFLTTAIGCKSTKSITVQQATGAVKLIDEPFTESKYRTDKDTYRSFQSYKHPNQNTARSYSFTLAKALLLDQIKSDLSNFVKGTETTYDKNGQDVSGLLVQRIANLAEGIVSDAILVDSKMFVETDGRYTCYTLVEKNRNAALRDVYQKTISDDDKLRILYEKKKIEEDYEKFKASQKN
jgi:hypothetical protein